MGLMIALILTLAGGDHCRTRQGADARDKVHTLAMFGGGAVLAMGLVAAGLWRGRRRS